MKHRQQVRKGKQVKNMNRLTSNKPVEEMGMYELAHNCCCYENGNAVYRDFEMEMDAREFARNLMVTLTDDELSLDDDVFDEEVLENLQYDPFSDVRGLIALFYRNLWAMADLRERLKEYEDAEEQGKIMKLPTAWPIKDYAHMPIVEIDGKRYVDKKIFVTYALNQLEDCMKDAFSEGEKTGIELSMQILCNI